MQIQIDPGDERSQRQPWNKGKLIAEGVEGLRFGKSGRESRFHS